MKIFDRLRFGDRPHLVTVRCEAVDVYRNQIIVWISIDVLRPLPAILDNGHGHNLSIGNGQLQRWSGASLKRIGELEFGHQRVVQYAALVRLHRNAPGRAALHLSNWTTPTRLRRGGCGRCRSWLSTPAPAITMRGWPWRRR